MPTMDPQTGGPSFRTIYQGEIRCAGEHRPSFTPGISAQQREFMKAIPPQQAADNGHLPAIRIGRPRRNQQAAGTIPRISWRRLKPRPAPMGSLCLCPAEPTPWKSRRSRRGKTAKLRAESNHSRGHQKSAWRPRNPAPTPPSDCQAQAA